MGVRYVPGFQSRAPKMLQQYLLTHASGSPPCVFLVRRCPQKNAVIIDSAKANKYFEMQIRRNKLLVTIGDGTILKKDGSIVRSAIGAEVQIWRLQDEEEG